MRKLYTLYFLAVILVSCKTEETPPEPVEQAILCEPEEPALYGKLSGMRLIVREVGWRTFHLQSTTENREGLEFAEPRLKNLLPSSFSACNIPESYLKDGQILRISGNAYIESSVMRFAKIVYFDNPESEHQNTRGAFLDYTEIEIVPQ